MPEEKLSARDNILALQKQMEGDQLNVAKELVELIGGEDMAVVLDKLTALRSRTIPMQALDQQINQLLLVMQNAANVGAQLYQQLLNQQQQAAAQQ